MDPSLRAESVEAVSAIAFEGIACGGVSVGEPKELMRATVEFTGPLLPRDRPRYLMGVGRPDDLVHAVAHGFDLFDCVLPTRAARHGLLYLPGREEGTLVIKHARYREDLLPPDPDCACSTCARHSRAYLRHLHISGEPTAATLMTVHNLHAILDLMRRIREALAENRFETWAAGFPAPPGIGKDSR
jgi:queuine tRNA-ribosyltransferase